MEPSYGPQLTLFPKLKLCPVPSMLTPPMTGLPCVILAAHASFSDLLDSNRRVSLAVGMLDISFTAGFADMPYKEVVELWLN